MKRLLFVAYYFPPAGWGGVQRASKWVKYLGELGWDPIILTTTQESYEVHDDSLLADIPDRVAVHRVPLATPEVVSDPGLRWLAPVAGKMLELIRTQSPQVVLMTGSPFFPFLAARLCRAVHDTPYVLDFRDPWATAGWWPHGRRIKGILKTAVERVAESLAVRGAARCLFAQPGIARIYQSVYPSLRHGRAVALPNGYDPEDFPGAGMPRPPAPARDRYLLVHTGSWTHSRTPGLILDGLDRLRKEEPALGARIEALFVGRSELEGGHPEGPGGPGRIPGVPVRFEPYVPHDRCVQILCEADLLWLDAGPRRDYVPGKIFEYLASGRPVVAAAHPDGQTARWLLEAGTGRIVERSAGSVARTLAELIRRLDGGGSLQPNREAVVRFSRKEQARRLSVILEQAAAGGS